jgi:hypothetical protein
MSHGSEIRIIAHPDIIEHKSCAVKRHAYTLAISDDLASAVQQNKRFPQPLGIALFFRNAA